MNTKKVKGTLDGIDGNAFAIMGHFQKLARRQGWSSDEIKDVLDEARKGNYWHLIATIESHMEEERHENF
jgi:hypothetical protein